MTIRQGTFIILTILWMAVIFFMSSRDARTSTEDSHFVGKAVGSMLYNDFETWTEDKQVAFANKVDYPIRKIAHAMEYAILAFFISGAAWSMDAVDKIGCRRLFLYIWLICILYAVSDEVHQAFVPGRACRVTDVGIDSAGAMAGNLIGLLFLKGRRR